MGVGRKSNTIRNLVYAWLAQGVTIIMNMIVRVIFVRVLSKDYVGIGGLFSNVITMLSLAELGIGSAIIYGLYEPLAKNNQRSIRALMQFYQKVYVMVGVLIGVVGIALTPYIGWFIKDIPDIPLIEVIYILFVLNAALSYFFSYRASLITADQKDYILKRIRMKVLVAMYFAQMIVLIVWRNYIGYLCIQIIFTISMNVGFSVAAEKLYPFLKNKERLPLETKQFREIVKNTKALLCHKVGEIAVFSTDNLIISKYSGLSSVADYSNYILIQETLNGILVQVFNAMAASIGNLVAIEKREKNIQVFDKVMFLNACLYSFCSICFLCLAQDFVRLCFGENYVVSSYVLLLIVINFYLSGMRKCTATFKAAYGLFWQNWFVPLLEAVVNLVTSLILVQYFGVAGVLLGTMISSVLAPVWVEPFVLYHYGFQENVFKYWKEYIKYMVLLIITSGVTWGISNRIIYIPIFSLFIRTIICLICIIVIYYLAFRKNDNFIYYLELFRSFVRKRKNAM